MHLKNDEFVNRQGTQLQQSDELGHEGACIAPGCWVGRGVNAVSTYSSFGLQGNRCTAWRLGKGAGILRVDDLHCKLRLLPW